MTEEKKKGIKRIHYAGGVRDELYVTVRKTTSFLEKKAGQTQTIVYILAD